MTPQDLAAMTAVVGIVKVIGAWPMITLFVFMSIGPWIGLWWFTRATEKRHSAVVKMYSDNVTLVKSYDLLSKELVDTIRLNTSANTELTSFLKNQVPCHERMKDHCK